MTDEEFLVHYGVPGMKWGKRKSSLSSGQRAAKTRKKNKRTERIAKGARIAQGVIGLAMFTSGIRRISARTKQRGFDRATKVILEYGSDYVYKD